MSGVDVEESYFACVTVANSNKLVTKGFRAGERYKARLIKTTEIKSMSKEYAGTSSMTLKVLD